MTTHLDPHRDDQLWSLYLEGDLESVQQQELEAHLRTCEECRREVRMLRQTVMWLGQLGESQEIQAPDDLIDNVNRRLRRQQRQKKRRVASENSSYGQNVTTGLIIATLLVLAFVLLFVLQNYS